MAKNLKIYKNRFGQIVFKAIIPTNYVVVVEASEMRPDDKFEAVKKEILDLGIVFTEEMASELEKAVY